MAFSQFTDILTEQLQRKLPGKEAHLQMVSSGRYRAMLKEIALPVKRSSVLILLFPDGNDIKTILIRRPEYNGIHSGQISFPGGKWEPGDGNLTETALRESREEVGIDPEGVTIAGYLTELYIPPSGYIVHPVIGFLDHPPLVTADPTEVAAVYRISLIDILAPENIQCKQVWAGVWSDEVPCYYIQDQVIWGATAMILSEFAAVIRKMPSLQWNR